MLSIFFFKGFTFRYLKQIVGDEPGVLGFWCVDFVSGWRKTFVFARPSFTFLGRAEPISWCRARGELCLCASLEAVCRHQAPAAGLCKYDILLIVLCGICMLLQWKLFIQTLWLHKLLKQYDRSPTCCPFYVKTAMVLIMLPILPMFEKVCFLWFWVC